MCGQFLTHGQLLGKVDVRLVDDDDTLELIDNLQHLVTIQRVARRIVGRAEPDDLGMGIAGSQQLVGRELIVLVQQNGTILDVVDVGTYLVHAIRGGDGHHIVYTRIAEHTISQVDGLVAAVAQEYHILGHPLHLLQHTFQFTLQ